MANTTITASKMTPYLENLMTYATREQMAEAIEANLTIGELKEEFDFPATECVVDLIEAYRLKVLYADYSQVRYNAVRKEALAVEAGARAKGADAKYDKPLLYPDEPVKYHSTGGLAPRELVDDDLWAILDEIKSLMNEGHEVKQLLRKAGMEDNEITELMREVQFNSNVDIREMVRHGGYQPKIDVYRIPDEELKQAESKDND